MEYKTYIATPENDDLSNSEIWAEPYKEPPDNLATEPIQPIFTKINSHNILMTKEKVHSNEKTQCVCCQLIQKHTWVGDKRVRDNYKVVLCAVLLTLFGLTLAMAGIAIEVSKDKSVQSYMFFAAAGLCLIPGVYHLTYLYCAIKQVKGFSFNDMPIFK